MQSLTPELWIPLATMLGLLLAVSVAAVAFNLNHHRRLVGQFERLAEHFGLELTIPPATLRGLYRRNPTLYGRCRGRELSIYPKGYGLDNTRQTDIAVRVATDAPKSLSLNLSRRNFTGKIGQIGRLKETPVGDEAFDGEFSLRAKDPQAARAWLNSVRRERVAALWPQGEAFLQLDDSLLTCTKFGLPYRDDDRLALETLVDLCLELASNKETGGR